MGAWKDAVEGYRNPHTAPVSDMAATLNTVVSDYSREIYFDVEKLRAVLLSQGMGEADALKVCLMTQAAGFREVMKPDSRTRRADLDRYIRNAVQETGLNRSVAMELARDIIWSAGLAFDYQPEGQGPCVDGQAYTIPASLYQSELESFEKTFVAAAYESRDLSNVDFSRLEPLVAAGIPKAKYYLGYCLLESKQGDPGRGIALLEEAAASGSIEAAAALGDYYFKSGPKDWGRAYDFYTGYGALALNKRRQAAVVSILNQKKYNRNVIILNSLFLLAMLVTVILAPGAAVYGAHRIMGVLCVLSSGAVLALTIWQYQLKPYIAFYWSTLSMFGLWSVYVMARLLL